MCNEGTGLATVKKIDSGDTAKDKQFDRVSKKKCKQKQGQSDLEANKRLDTETLQAGTHDQARHNEGTTPGQE